MEVVTISVELLTEDPANARKHDERNLGAIRDSLAQFGQQKPIVINSANEVIAGNGTLAAARALGWNSIQAVVSDLEGLRAKAFAIADNRTGDLSEWDEPALVAALEALEDDLLGAGAFSEAELAALDDTEQFRPRPFAIGDLRPHPRNYKQHPEDQLKHIAQSIREHGLYRNVVCAKDGTILVGHGVIAALKMLGARSVPVIEMDIEPEDQKALKLLAADNEIGHLAEVDDRALTNLLREVKDIDADGLLGTGFDDAMLANMLMVTRPRSEVRDFDEAAEWVGMPEYEVQEKPWQLIVSFKTKEDRIAFVESNKIKKHGSEDGRSWSARWPPRGREDLVSVKYEVDPETGEEKVTA